MNIFFTICYKLFKSTLQIAFKKIDLYEQNVIYTFFKKCFLYKRLDDPAGLARNNICFQTNCEYLKSPLKLK